MTRLRGEQNQDIIDTEFNRIKMNFKILAKEREEAEAEMEAAGSEVKEATILMRVRDLATDGSFLKPFAFLLVIFGLGFEWTGLPAIAFYMVPLLK